MNDVSDNGIVLMWDSDFHPLKHLISVWISVFWIIIINQLGCFMFFFTWLLLYGMHCNLQTNKLNHRRGKWSRCSIEGQSILLVFMLFLVLQFWLLFSIGTIDEPVVSFDDITMIFTWKSGANLLMPWRWSDCDILLPLDASISYYWFKWLKIIDAWEIHYELYRICWRESGCDNRLLLKNTSVMYTWYDFSTIPLMYFKISSFIAVHFFNSAILVFFFGQNFRTQWAWGKAKHPFWRSAR